MAWRGPPQFGTLARGRFCPFERSPFLSTQRSPRPANERKREPRLGHIPTRPRPDRIARAASSPQGLAATFLRPVMLDLLGFCDFKMLLSRRTSREPRKPRRGKSVEFDRDLFRVGCGRGHFARLV